MDSNTIDTADVQGLVRFGYGHLPEACFLLYRVSDAGAVRTWLSSVNVTTAEKLASPPETAIQIAFTCDGLRTLGVPDDTIGAFAPEFVAGMAGEESRSRRLGDVAANDPTNWQWGARDKGPHLMLMLYAAHGKLEAWRQSVLSTLPASGLTPLQTLHTAPQDGYEPFGFKDGISQPEIDWEFKRRPDSEDQLAFTNIVAAGEFLLGYPNEYSLYTDRPLIDARQDPHTLLLPALDRPERRDLARNGAYLVMRHLQQDVRAFWQFLNTQASQDGAAQKLAEAMVGRTMEGEPLVPLAEQPIPGIDDQYNQFTYGLDKDGDRCPIGAHIRRANPRTGDLPDGTTGPVSTFLSKLGFCRESFPADTISSTRFHRLLRRGRKYGGKLSPAEAVQPAPAGDEERGLYFICINANIGRQFEFVQNAWIMGTKFGGLGRENDPLLGNRASAATFSVPCKEGPARRLTGLPQFVTVRGGAYFFLPSVRALRFLAQLRDEPDA